MREAALSLVKRLGWSIFPLKPRSKEPATRNGLKDADNDPVGIGAWWENHPQCNIAAAMGQVSGGVVAIDLDNKPEEGVDGYQALREWERAHGELPETVTSLTGSGGMHIFYRVRGTVRCSVNRELGVDIRGDGGYVVAPPSIHPNGNSYAWENGPDEYAIAWADDNVMAFIDHVRPKGSDGARFELPETVGKGQRNDTMFKLAASLQSRGYSDSDVYDLVSLRNAQLCKPPLPDDEVRKIVESALAYDKGEQRVAKASDASTGLCADEVQASVVSMLDMTPKGGVLATSYNFGVILANDPRLAGRWWYDVNGWSKMVTLPLPWDDGTGVRAVQDADYAALDMLIAHDYKISKKASLIDAVVATCAANRHNPVTELIDSFEWDGVPRVSGMLVSLFGTQDNEYNSMLSTLIMHSLVKRAYYPGCKCDFMFVASGAQGCGKSSGVRALSLCVDWLCESLSSFEGDSAVEKIRGALVVEVPELSAFKKSKDMETIKDFITRRTDTIRPKYARETEQRQRGCILFGTTNMGGFMYDTTGNRRFLPFECGFTPPVYDTVNGGEELDQYVHQLYAEARAWLFDPSNSPHELVVPASMAPLAEAYRDLHVVDDPRVGVIEAYLDSVLKDETRIDKNVCIRELLVEALNVNEADWGGPLSNDVAEIMRNVGGWVGVGRRYTKAYGRQRCYSPAS